VKDSVCNESGTEPLQVCTIAILNIPVLTEDILLHFSEGGGRFMKSPCCISAYALLSTYCCWTIWSIFRKIYMNFILSADYIAWHTFLQWVQTMENLHCKVEATLTPLWVLKW